MRMTGRKLDFSHLLGIRCRCGKLGYSRTDSGTLHRCSHTSDHQSGIPLSFINNDHITSACLLEAHISETQMLETIKLETIPHIKWRLLPHGIIERILINQPVLKLHPHDLHCMRLIAFLPNTSKIRLVAMEFDEQSGFRRNIAWIARFGGRKEAKTWLNIIQMVTKGPFTKSGLKLPAAETLSSVQEILPLATLLQDAGNGPVSNGLVVSNACLMKSDNKASQLEEKPSGSSSVLYSRSEKDIAQPPPKPPRTNLPVYPCENTAVVAFAKSSTFSSLSVASTARITNHRLAISNRRISEMPAGHNQTLLCLPCSASRVSALSRSELNFNNRRYVVLRGCMEKHQPRHLQRLRFHAWCVVTWIFYSDGTLEEYAKTKSRHDLLNVMSICHFIVHVPMSKAEKQIGDPSLMVSVDCHLDLTPVVTGRTMRYKAPNKLMQIQWLATLTSPRRSQAGRMEGWRNELDSGLIAKCCMPRKLSLMQEKCLVDIFGFVVPLWVNVIWEYSNQSFIRRRYEDRSRHVLKQITVLSDITPQRDTIITIPESNKTKNRNKIPHEGNSQNFVTPNSKRRFRISQLGGREEDEIYVRAESSQLRDEWYYILRKLHSDLMTDDGPAKTEGPSVNLQIIPEETPAVLLHVSVRATNSALDYSMKDKPQITLESFSMSAADNQAAMEPCYKEGQTSSDSYSCASGGQGDERLFYPSLLQVWPIYSPTKTHHGEDVAKRKRRMIECGEKELQVLPRLTDDQAHPS